MELHQKNPKKNQIIYSITMIKDYLTLAIKNIRHRSLRSWLTVIGIIIGIASIVALISVSQGLENAIKIQFEQMGSDKLYIMSNSATGLSEYLTQADVDLMESLPEIEWVSPYIMVSDTVEYGNYKGFMSYILGVDPAPFEKSMEEAAYGIEEGRYLEPNERNSVMIGYRISKDFYDKEVHVNNQLKIKDTKIKVVGIMGEIGNPQDDSQIYMNIEDIRSLFNKTTEVTMIQAKVKPGYDMDLVADKVTAKLEKKKEEKESFMVSTPEQLLKQFGDILMLVQVILGGIASISLLVGGIGIMNSMYTAVLQRTREIGVMKSVGATNKAISSIFLIEGSLFGLVGGLIGIGLGTLIAYLVKYAAELAGYSILAIRINVTMLLFVLIFSVGIGLISSWLPARRAVKLKPVEALK
ncbi:MAG: ABC transporter permease [Candidatus Nanoarchaeia archaeon]|nr:ABC transporter permease [Candidatus Nanoarchaeia archaeon]